MRSPLPEAVQNSLIGYVNNYLERQTVSLSRDYVIEMQVIGDRIQAISVTPTPINLKDRESLQQLQEAIKVWRSANLANGSIRIELLP